MKCCYLISFILFCIFVSSSLSNQYIQPIISRANWGVVFHQTAKVLNGVSVYYHTFVIPAPNLPTLRLERLQCDDEEIKDFMYCEAANHLIEGIQLDAQRKINQANTRLTAAMNLVPNIDDVQITPGGNGPRTRRKKRSVTAGASQLLSKSSFGFFESVLESQRCYIRMVGSSNPIPS